MCPYCRSLFAALIAPGRIGKVATGAKRTFLPRPAGVGAPSRAIPCPIRGGRQCPASTMTTSLAFEVTSKRRTGFPSETPVKRGLRFVPRGDKELVEKDRKNGAWGKSGAVRVEVEGRRRLQKENDIRHEDAINHNKQT